MRTVRCSGRLGADGGVWTEFLTHACENITVPQLLLRTVIISILGTTSGKLCKRLINVRVAYEVTPCVLMKQFTNAFTNAFVFKCVEQFMTILVL